MFLGDDGIMLGGARQFVGKSTRTVAAVNKRLFSRKTFIEPSDIEALRRHINLSQASSLMSSSDRNPEVATNEPVGSQKFRQFVVSDSELSLPLSPQEEAYVKALNPMKNLSVHAERHITKLAQDLANPMLGALIPKHHDTGSIHAPNEPTKLGDIYMKYNPSTTLHASLPSNKTLKKKLKMVNYVENEGIPFKPSLFQDLFKPITFTDMYRTIIRGTKHPSVKFSEKLEALDAIQADSSKAIPLFLEWAKTSKKRFHAFAMADFAVRVINTHGVSPGTLEALVKLYLAIPEDMIIRDEKIPLHAPDYMRAWFTKFRGTKADLKDEKSLQKLRAVQQLDVDLAALREFYYDLRDSMDTFVIRMYHVLLDRNIVISDEVETAYLKALLRSDFSHDAVAFVMNRLMNNMLDPDHLELILGVVPQVNASPVISHLLRILQMSRGFKTAEETFASLKPEVQLSLVSAFHRSDVVFDKEVAYQRFKILVDPNRSKSYFYPLLANEEEIQDGFDHSVEYRNAKAESYHAARIASGQIAADAKIDPSEYFAHESEYANDYVIDTSVFDFDNPDHIEEVFGEHIEPFEGETSVEKFDKLLRAVFESILNDLPELRNSFNPETALTPKIPVSVEQLVDGSPAMYLFGKCVEANAVPFYPYKTADIHAWFKPSEAESIPALDFSELRDPCWASTTIAHTLYELANYVKSNPSAKTATSLRIKLPLDKKLREYYDKITSLQKETLANDPSVQSLLKLLENKLTSTDLVSQDTHELYAAINARIGELAEKSQEATAIIQGPTDVVLDYQYHNMILEVMEHFELPCTTVDGHVVVQPVSLDKFISKYNTI